MTRLFSKRLRSLRLEKGLSQKSASQQLGISQALLSHYETGIRECGLAFIVRVSDFYDVSCDYLLGKSDQKKQKKSIFSSTDIPSDTAPSVVTLMHALHCMFHESATIFKVEKEDSRLYLYYKLTTYKMLLLARQRSFFGRKNFGLDPDFADIAVEGMLAHLEREMFVTDGLPMDPESYVLVDTPQCIQTIIDDVEQQIIDVRSQEILIFKQNKQGKL